MARKKLYEGTSLIDLAQKWGKAINRSKKYLGIRSIKSLLRHSLIDTTIVAGKNTELSPKRRDDLLRLSEPKLTPEKAKMIASDIIDLISTDNINSNEYQSIENLGWINQIYSHEVIIKHIRPLLDYLSRASKAYAKLDLYLPEPEPRQIQRIGFPAPEYIRDEFADREKADYENSANFNKIEFYDEHSDLIDLVNGDIVICDPKEESYFESEASGSLSDDVELNVSAIASVNAYMESFDLSIVGSNGEWIKLPKKTRYYFMASEIKSDYSGN